MRLKENLWSRGMTPWKTSRRRRWNVQSLANCFIYGYWTLLLCQTLHLLGVGDFFFKIVLLNCYLLPFANHPPSYFYFWFMCMYDPVKDRPVWGDRACFWLCFLNGTDDFLWVHSLLLSLLCASPCRLHHSGSKHIPSQLLMLSWQALREDFQVSL